ncbi:MAG: single-stranded-DNA-specific exonuclease RecJ [Rhodospirillaceae bacterium]|jgi:single-stranded-DNA-specific exonuclease|nr:single-stranded-DNA-specific exonuclease RecJ [Rhodospirillaceae bacterium]
MEEAFLNIEQSLTGRYWQMAIVDERKAMAICQRLDLPDTVGRVLSTRNIDLDSISFFLNPKLRELLPDPFHLLDMRIAVDRLVKAIIEGDTIGIFGDYDVDGATSLALLHRFFTAVGVPVRTYIPDRITEGYGPNIPALLTLRTEGINIVITVDCGTTAFNTLDVAYQIGLDLIVVDHHKSETKLPKAFAVINPNRLDESSSYGYLAGVGVSFLLIIAINSELRKINWFSNERQTPNLLQWLDIVALGTICDMVPLIGLNRAIVSQGLKILALRTNVGISALVDNSNIKERLTSNHVGYTLGPRINAAGRIGRADLGMQLLVTDDQIEATRLANSLEIYNKDRKDLTEQILQAAIEQVESAENRISDSNSIIIVAGNNWHPGIIGIIAARLRDRYNKPACVIAMNEIECKGSGRSIPGLDLGATIIAARQSGLLINGGGHALAVGFSVTRERLKELSVFLVEHLTAQMNESIIPILRLDGILNISGISIDLVENLNRLEPFGIGNAEPRFVIVGSRIIASRVVGMNHISCKVAGRSGKSIKAIAYNSVDSKLGQTLLINNGTPLHLTGTLRIDNWQGKKNIQLLIDDAATIT